ncbi:Hsp20/alpha crystallin family protein [Candidatus Bathyarchaeota archaeon]|nr:MAG: Hsp20/alpha crystallin family protein [Candidatus Bathyarchaeota archaeon]
MVWDEWWRRRRSRFPFFGSWFFEEFDEMMKEMERMMEEMFRGFPGELPKNLLRERKLPDGRIVREFGPVVYGYSITIGPDGKPIVREFGNVKPSLRGIKPSLDIKMEREPLVDVMSDDGNIKVIAELPGVEKQDIKLHATSKTLTISVDTPQRKYYKELELPEEVDPKTAKSVYRNGVLEVTMAKVKEKPKGEPIKVE